MSHNPTVKSQAPAADAALTSDRPTVLLVGQPKEARKSLRQAIRRQQKPTDAPAKTEIAQSITLTKPNQSSTKTSSGKQVFTKLPALTKEAKPQTTQKD